MSVLDRAEKILLPLIDGIYGRAPQPLPGHGPVKRCRIVSHRGEHDRRGAQENTIAAFDAAVALGVWGIEFDVRWTRDLTPVVIHDPDLRRVFGLPQVVAECTLGQLQRACPQVPALAEVIHRYGGRVHLMVEVKAENYPEPGRQNRMLGDLFSALTPGRDFHLLSLDPAVFRLTAFAPPSAWLPVARLNLAQLSRMAIRERLAGVAGHYALLGAGAIRRHHDAGQQVGTGYIRSRNLLLREIRRGVDWVFSNHAGSVQRLLRRLQSSAF
jgi:glycerophosphoryl diester phosphodiesterase